MSVAPCSSPAISQGVVVFEPAVFKTQYPAFATLTDPVLQVNFDIATLFLNNSCCSVVKDANIRERLLYMVVAHIAALLQGENGKPPSGIVGRVTEASEGTVSVSAAYVNDMSMSEAYFSQTPYGAMFWMATAGYRMFHYMPPTYSNDVGGGRGRGFYPPTWRGGC